MMRKLSAAIIYTLIFPASSSAQDGFQMTLGGVEIEQAYSVQQTLDGGYIVVGYTESAGAGLKDAFMIKTNPEGGVLWTKTFGGGSVDVAYHVQQITDENYIMTGLTYSFGAGSGDVYLIKTDTAGNKIWTRTFGGKDLDWGYSVQQTADYGFIIVGSTNSFGAGSGDVYLIKTDSSGNMVWQKTFGGIQNDQGRSVWQTWPDMGFIIAGSTNSFGSGESDVYLIKTDSLGTTTWSKTFGDVDSDHGLSVQQIWPDGGYIVAGDKFSSHSSRRDSYLIKTDSSGDTLWTKTYGGPASEAGSSVRVTSDDGFIFTGYTESIGFGGRDLLLVKTDSSGDVLWEQNYGGAEFDVGYAIWQTTDGGYIITGYTESFGSGGRDVYLIKTDPNGIVGIGPGSGDPFRFPRAFLLSQNYPNPFNPSTTIAFDIPGSLDVTQRVSLTVYDLRGRQVRRLIDSGLTAGSHRTTWDGRDDRGMDVPSGIYIYTLETGGETFTRKMTVLK